MRPLVVFCLFVCLFYLFLKFILRERERENAMSWEGVERESSITAEPDSGLELPNHEIMTWAEIKNQMPKQLSYPDAQDHY